MGVESVAKTSQSVQAKVVKNLQYVVVQAEKCAIFVLFLSKSA
jgi:hypothetical protein